MVEQVTAKEFREQPGGSVMIDYKDLTVGAPLNAIKEALDLLKMRPDKDHVLLSVQLSIESVRKKIANNTFTREEALACSQDIAIWYANEILEGRAKLEEKIIQ